MNIHGDNNGGNAKICTGQITRFLTGMEGVYKLKDT
jgi:hypothetical protein